MDKRRILIHAVVALAALLFLGMASDRQANHPFNPFEKSVDSQFFRFQHVPTGQLRSVRQPLSTDTGDPILAG